MGWRGVGCCCCCCCWLVLIVLVGGDVSGIVVVRGLVGGIGVFQGFELLRLDILGRIAIDGHEFDLTIAIGVVGVLCQTRSQQCLIRDKSPETDAWLEKRPFQSGRRGQRWSLGRFSFFLFFFLGKEESSHAIQKFGRHGSKSCLPDRLSASNSSSHFGISSFPSSH